MVGRKELNDMIKKIWILMSSEDYGEAIAAYTNKAEAVSAMKKEALQAGWDGKSDFYDTFIEVNADTFSIEEVTLYDYPVSRWA